MCGICGIYNLKGKKTVTESEVQSMCETLYHRGPNDHGFHIEGTVGLGMRRLSIIDVAGGKQPISNEDNTIWTVFNGEIYNYKELRRSLIEKGHHFLTNSDTECIVHLYEEMGAAFLKELRGMFALAVWDGRQRRLLIARDRLGIKPLFYAEVDNQLLFASEMKAILKHCKLSREIDEDALTAYFILSYIPAPFTIFKHIKKLEPGHFLVAQNGQSKIQKYWDLEFKPDRSKSEGHFIEGLMALLRDSVTMRLMSEVPLGAFLSGGIDSSTVVALMSKESESPVNTVSIGFGGDTGGYLDERKYARKVAARYHTNHREYEVLPNFQHLVKTIVQAFDEPLADDSTIPSYYVCKAARENVTVALSGLGGDEVFGGYERYLGFMLSRTYEKIPFFIREKLIRKAIEKLPERADGHYTVNHMKRFVRSSSLPRDRRYLGYLSIMNGTDNLFSNRERFRQGAQICEDLILSHYNASNASDDLNRIFYCDLKTYVPEDILAVTDRLSMHHSLEVRVPFLDHKFLEYSATIPPEMKMKWFRKKYLLKKATANVLPREVTAHRKQGFVGPLARWLKTDLKPYVVNSLSEDKLKRHDFFNYKVVRSILDEHFTGKELHDTLIWSMIIFQTWFDLYIDPK